MTCRLLLAVVAGIFAISACASSNPQTQAASEYKKILELQRQKEWAARVDEKLMKLPEMTPADLERAGDNFARQGNAVMAFVNYNKALERNPDQPGLHYKMGCLFVEKGLYAEAQKEFEEVLKKDKNSAAGLEGMGRIFFAKGDLDKAAE